MFDNPIFWIVAIWWLLTTVLGAKARRKRRALASPPERRTSPLPGPARGGEEPGYDSAIEPDEEGMERGSALPPQPVQSRVKPAIPLERLWHSLGIEPEVVQFRALADQEEEVVEMAPPSPEPEHEPVDPPVPRSPKESEQTPPTVHRRYGRTIGQAVTGLSPLQQAAVLKEILDRPRALRRGIR